MRWRSIFRVALPPLVALGIPIAASFGYLRYLEERKAVAAAAARLLQEGGVTRFERDRHSCCFMLDLPTPPPKPDDSDDGCWASTFCAGRLDLSARDLDPQAPMVVTTANGSRCELMPALGHRLDPDLALFYESSLAEPTFYRFSEQTFIAHATLPIVGGTIVATAGAATVQGGTGRELAASDVVVDVEWALW